MAGFFERLLAASAGGLSSCCLTAVSVFRDRFAGQQNGLIASGGPILLIFRTRFGLRGAGKLVTASATPASTPAASVTIVARCRALFLSGSRYIRFV